MPRMSLSDYDAAQSSAQTGGTPGALGYLANALTREPGQRPEYGQMPPGLAEIASGGGITGAALRAGNPAMWDPESGYAKWISGGIKGKRPEVPQAAREDMLSAVLGTFGGVNAKTADMARLATARDMLTKGADNEAIRQATGWFRGMDGKWRFEIPDNSASIISERIGKSGSYGRIGEHLMHDDLFSAYPDLPEIGAWIRGNDKYSVKGTASGRHLSHPERIHSFSDATTLPTTLHELQHAIQEREHFAMGGSPSAEMAGGSAVDPAKLDEYRRLAGEIEARDVSNRMSLTPEQRRITPPDLRRNAIVRMNYPGMSF